MIAVFLCCLAVRLFALDLAPLPPFLQSNSSLQIVSPAHPSQPWTVAGERGAFFGRQNGRFEAWLWPVKVFSNFSIRAEIADYPVPIDVNALAAEIRVTPAETVIIYSHAAFTVRQHLFAARGGTGSGIAASAIFEIDSVRPLSLTFSFTPDMLRMWPAPNHGRPNGEWIAQGDSGFYILHTDDDSFSGLVAMPRTKPGIMVPYQEHPQTYPLELKLAFDPKRDRGLLFPLLLAMNDGTGPASQMAKALAQVSAAYGETQRYYGSFFDHRLTVETPDKKVDEALKWAEISLDQMQVQYHGETGMAAGYYESADSARPGYAWFFGRDTLWSTYAISSYGDFALTRRALDFLFKRQRDDGKIMHEYSQSAESLDWKATPYFYASADSTQLLVMAMADYVKISADVSYLQQHWPAITKVYAFLRRHQASNGIYNNKQGTGWVESWPQGMPYQEVYLAALDAQAATAMANLATLMNDTELAASAKKKAGEIGQTVEAQFYSQPDDFYAFSRGENGTLDRTASIYPAVAWWDGTFRLAKPESMLRRWSSDEFSSDWGTRDISNQTAFYDPISYHQGSIWPLFTGWVSLAEYRAGRSLSGYSHLMQNANLTWAQDLGSVTELLSGDLYQPLGRSSSHQMWSSAMVISPLARGLFGLDWDAFHHNLFLRPQLPATWNHAKLRNVPLGTVSIDIDISRSGSDLLMQTSSSKPIRLCLHSDASTAGDCTAAPASVHRMRVPLRPVEVSISNEPPEPGSRTRQLKVTGEHYGERSAQFSFSAPGGEHHVLPVRLNRSGVTVDGATLTDGKLQLQIPPGNGYRTQTVTFRW